MKLRILHITPDFNYGDGRSYYVSLLIKYFKKRGHFVHLITNGSNSLDRAGGDVTVVPGLSNKISFAGSVKRLGALAKELKIDVVHSHHRYYELLANSIPRRKFRTVSTALSIVDKRYFVDYRSDKIISVSNSVTGMLLGKFGVNRNKIEKIPNFVDTGEIRNQQDKIRELKIDKGGFTLLSVGRFHREKNQITLLRALQILNDRDVKLILIGEGEDEKLLKEYASSNKLNVDFYPPQSSLGEFYRLSDACILTSTRDPLPGFMLQSGLYGKPFAGTKVDGIADTISHGENGLLFPEKDEELVAETISLLKSDSAIRDRISGKLHKLVIKEFTEVANIPKIEKLYYSLFS